MILHISALSLVTSMNSAFVGPLQLDLDQNLLNQLRNYQFCKNIICGFRYLPISNILFGVIFSSLSVNAENTGVSLITYHLGPNTCLKYSLLIPYKSFFHRHTSFSASLPGTTSHFILLKLKMLLLLRISVLNTFTHFD